MPHRCLGQLHVRSWLIRGGVVGRELLQEVLHQEWNIVAPVAQWWQLERDHVEPVIEVLAKRTGCDHCRQVGVGRADDPDIHFRRLAVAHALELPFLQCAQQLHLQARAHRTHFVKEQRALVGLLESALTRPDGSGKRASHVAEEFGFEQRFGNRTAVDRDESMPSPWTVDVDGPRHHFLAGARLSFHENGAARGCHRFEQLIKRPHGAALSEDTFEAVPLLELRSEVGVLLFQAALFAGLVQHVHQFVELKRFGDEVGGAALDGVHGIPDRAVTRDDDTNDPGIARDRFVDHLAAVDARHAKIRDDDIERELLEEFEGSFPVLGLRHLEAMLLQSLRHQRPERLFVVDEEKMGSRLGHWRVCPHE